MVLVFVIAIVVVLMSGRAKRERPIERQPGDEPPPPSFEGVVPPPNFGAGYNPPPPDFSSGGETPPGYGYAPQPAYDQTEEQQSVYEDTATAVEQPPRTEEIATEAEPRPVQTQPEIVEEEEDMRPKPAPLPEDAPKVTMKFNDLPSSDQIAESAKARKSDTWTKKDGKKDILDEILDGTAK